MREIDINTILKVLKKRFIVLIIIAILTSLISGFYYTSQSKPVYSSKATFLLDRQPIITEKDGKQEITYPMTQKELIEVSIALIKTDDIAERIIVNAGYTGDISPSDFRKMIKIEQEAETALFKLTVSNVNLTMAYDLAMEAERIIPAELTDTLQGKAKIVSADTPKPDTKRKPVIPVKTILVLNLIAVATSYALLLIFELLSSTISEPDDLKPNFSLPVLGQIAHWKNLKDKATSKGQDNNSKNQVLLNDETPFIIVEGFNNIRTNLLHLSSDYKCPVYATASQQSEAGKSIIISNIALSFANIGKKVLLIDADMRFPRQSMIFGTQAEKGLSNFLANYSKSDVNFNDYISKTNYANLDLITSGEIPKNPSDLLSSNATAKLIEYAKDIYDVIFIDLPPIGPVSDAVIISSLVNGYFLVVRAGETNTKSIEQSLEILEFSKAKVSGFILNNMNTKSLKDCCQYSYE